MFAVRNEETSLDIVQDAMMRLAEKYGDRPGRRVAHAVPEDPAERHPGQLPAVESSFPVDHLTIIACLPETTTMTDPLETFSAENESEGLATPHRQLERSQLLGVIEKEIERLPPRQREAFLMRYWEEMDIAETAAAMGCSEGSVKTHCSRATHTLAAALKAKGIEL
jgi:RNA polymerase sigma-70 factor (ECF subfamily)